MSLIGERVGRGDAESKVRGEAVYGIDHREPRMLHGCIVRSTHPSARIVRIALDRAASMPGVHAVVTGADAPALGGWLVKDQRALALERVRYHGEPVAAVCADTLEQAEAAAAAMVVEYEPLEPVLDARAALVSGAPLVHDDLDAYESKVGMPPARRGGNLAWEASLTAGDVKAAFAAAELVVEDRFETARQHQLFLEPRAAVARWDGRRIEIHSSIQFPFNVRERVAELLGLPMNAVRIVVPAVGGGFGGKLDAALEPIAALLARAAGRPVRLANSMADELATVAVRDGAEIILRTALRRDGKILGQEGSCLMDSGAYAGESPGLAGLAQLAFTGTYRVGACAYTTRLAHTNTAPTGAFRGVCGAYVVFAVERHMDRIADELQIDPRELRRRNLHEPGDTTPGGQELTSICLREALDRVERMGIVPHEPPSPGKLRGTGVALATWLTVPLPGSAVVKLEEDGGATLVTAAVEIGSGAVTQGLRQIVADRLGLDPRAVHVSQPETDAAPYDAGAQGSRTVHVTGEAARRAAQEVREQVLRLASALLEVAPEDLELRDGAVAVAGSPGARLTLGDVARAALTRDGPICATGKHVAPAPAFDPACFAGALATTMNAPTSHAHLAEVEVDRGTGQVTVLRYLVAQDVGRAINPGAIEAQIQGGVAQGIGYALFEELRLRDGVVVDTSLESYRIPTALDVPAVEIDLLEHPDAHGPHGAKGVGEPPIVPVAAAIVNAVSAAIGRPLRRLPITPMAVLEALDEPQSSHGVEGTAL